ncbi:MAG TPA: MFS transporter, partial [Thermomicrobiales bacterium]|nr:MFS transporter [Thermomicrobiales bacterium]
MAARSGPPWHSAAFRGLWCASLASAGAQGMERTTTAWLVVAAGGGPLAVGLALAARSLPSLLLGLPAGTLADRADRRRQLLVVAGAAALVMAAVGGILQARAISPWQVTGIAFAAGCLQVFDTPARQALVLDTVAAEAAQRALALNALAVRLAVALGAVAAGALIVGVGLPRCYLAVAAAYCASAALLLSLRVPRHARVAGPPPGFGRGLREAARLLVADPAVRTLSVVGITCEILAFSYGSALPIIAHDVLRAGAEGLGTLNAAAAIGGTIAVLLVSLIPDRVRREALLGSVFVLYGLSLLALSAARSLALAAAVLVVTGLCAGAFDLLQQTLLQLAVPPDRRGRAVGIWVLGVGSAPAGNIEMGLLGSALGAPGALAINGTLTVLAAAALLAQVPR